MLNRINTQLAGDRPITVLIFLILLQFFAAPKATRFFLSRCAAAPVASPTDAQSSELNQYIVTGHVKDLDGHAIAGASIEWGSHKKSFSRRQRVTTDKDGAYRIVITKPGRDDQFAASAAGYATELRQSTFEPGEQVRDFILRTMPQREHVVAGTVVDGNGAPVADARLEAFTPVQGSYSSFSMPTGRDYFPGPDRVATTDNQGRFRIADLSTEQVQLNVQAKHRYVNDANYPVHDGVKVTMMGSGKPGVIQGRIVDAVTNKPPQNVRDIRIVARYATKNHNCSDDDGHFLLPDEFTLGEAYYIYVYANGYTAAETKIHAVSLDSAEFKEIELTLGPSLRGKLVDAATGQPVKNAALVYGATEVKSYMEWSDLDKYADGHHSLKFVQHVTSNDSGEFWFAEPKDLRGMIIAFIPGYQRVILKPDDRAIDAANGELLIRLKLESVFAGVVLQNGKPLANVSVTVSGQTSKDPTQFPETVHTDTQGRYSFGRLAPGRYFVHAGPYTRVATIREGEKQILNLGQDIGPIAIHGNAIPFSSIEACPEFGWDYTSITTQADGAGEYELRGLKPGKYRLTMDSGLAGGIHSHPLEIQTNIDHASQQIDLRPQQKAAPNPAAEMKPFE